MLKILAGKRNQFFDVFHGDGWEDWSRYIVRNNKLIHVGGRVLSKPEMKEVGHVLGHG